MTIPDDVMTLQLKQINDKLVSVHNAVKGVNGKPGLVGDMAVVKSRLETVEKSVAGIPALPCADHDRRITVNSIALERINRAPIWILALITCTVLSSIGSLIVWMIRT